MKEKFLKVYANLPLAMRNDIIYVLTYEKYKNQPMTWNSVWIEVKNDTEVGKYLLERLTELKFI